MMSTLSHPNGDTIICQVQHPYREAPATILGPGGQQHTQETVYSRANVRIQLGGLMELPVAVPIVVVLPDGNSLQIEVLRQHATDVWATVML